MILLKRKWTGLKGNLASVRYSVRNGPKHNVMQGVRYRNKGLKKEKVPSQSFPVLVFEFSTQRENFPSNYGAKEVPPQLKPIDILHGVAYGLYGMQMIGPRADLHRYVTWLNSSSYKFIDCSNAWLKCWSGYYFQTRVAGGW